ncbi:MAG: hypothetical protein OHK0029_39290 [Armatimonadaceae bacterium]
MEQVFKIRNRHTGEVLAQATAWADGTLRRAYLGHRLGKDLRNADLRGADLTEADLTGCDLSDADLTGTNLVGAEYDLFTRFPAGVRPAQLGAVRVAADLRGASRVGADFSGLDLTGAELSGADLTGAKLIRTRLVRARLRGTNLCGADLTDADLSEAVLVGIRTDENTQLPKSVPLPAPQIPGDAEDSKSSLDSLTDLLKALAHPSRLQLIGLLTEQKREAADLARTLDIEREAVLRHLRPLQRLGIIRSEQQGRYRVFSLDDVALQEALQQLPREAVRLAANETGGLAEDTFEGRTLAAHFDGDRLLNIPTRRKKLLVVLGRLSREFEMTRQYDEKAVSAVLRRFHDDFATLRRALVDYRFLLRKNGVYWRIR